jgi:hypothetical protein
MMVVLSSFFLSSFQAERKIHRSFVLSMLKGLRVTIYCLPIKPTTFLLHRHSTTQHNTTTYKHTTNHSRDSRQNVLDRSQRRTRHAHQGRAAPPPRLPDNHINPLLTSVCGRRLSTVHAPALSSLAATVVHNHHAHPSPASLGAGVHRGARAGKTVCADVCRVRPA